MESQAEMEVSFAGKFQCQGSTHVDCCHDPISLLYREAVPKRWVSWGNIYMYYMYTYDYIYIYIYVCIYRYICICIFICIYVDILLEGRTTQPN